SERSFLVTTSTRSRVSFATRRAKNNPAEPEPRTRTSVSVNFKFQSRRTPKIKKPFLKRKGSCFRSNLLKSKQRNEHYPLWQERSLSSKDNLFPCPKPGLRRTIGYRSRAFPLRQWPCLG